MSLLSAGGVDATSSLTRDNAMAKRLLRRTRRNA